MVLRLCLTTLIFLKIYRSLFFNSKLPRYSYDILSFNKNLRKNLEKYFTIFSSYFLKFNLIVKNFDHLK